MIAVAVAQEEHEPGKEDPAAISLLTDVVARVARHIERVEAERDKIVARMQHDVIAEIYRNYLGGRIRTYKSNRIRTREGLSQELRDFFLSFGIELSREDLSTFAPERSVISGEHRGPKQFAKFVIGRLRDKHWKTVHNWFNEKAVVPTIAFGRDPSSDEIAEYVHREALKGTYAWGRGHQQWLETYRAFLHLSLKEYEARCQAAASHSRGHPHTPQSPAKSRKPDK